VEGAVLGSFEACIERGGQRFVLCDC
jgi:hypothetical protein